jgi:hypothetical protein
MSEYEIFKTNPTEQNPITIDDYPYGFRQRTKIRYWIESDKNKGDRFCSQTLNPKTNEWNKPKKSTYSAIMVMRKDKSNGHISYDNLYYSTAEDEQKSFLERVQGYEFTETQKKQLNIIKAWTKAYEGVEFVCKVQKFRHKITGEIIEQVPIFHMNEYEEVKDELKEGELTQEEIKQAIKNKAGHEFMKLQRGEQ